MLYLKTFNENYNDIIGYREQLLKEVEDKAFDADSGFDIFNKWLNTNNLYLGADIPDIPKLLTIRQMKDFISYYKKETQIKKFKI